ncbi:MAG: riboflavin biosynthesis protein RibF [Coriobacteriia bacterium]|nr:riboflavin biosynthesis protein RibF [Coriobacteriia bacterium]
MGDFAFYGETVCVLGVFDGLHLGHQYLLDQAQRQADQAGLPLLIVTFDRDPDELLSPDHDDNKLLSDSERLLRLSLLDYGGTRHVDTKAADGLAVGQRNVLTLPFNRELASLPPVDFLDLVLKRHCIPKAIHVGADFRFGYQARGTVETLNEWAGENDAYTFSHRLLDDGGKPISATRIRTSLLVGDLAEANRLLTRPHHLPGTVIHGQGFGQEVGFPTANILGLSKVIQPADGVYAGFFETGGQILAAAISVGVPLTFDNRQSSLEVYCLDFHGDLYGLDATVYFIERLRPMIAFANVDELREQIALDVDRSRQITAKARILFE